MTGQRRRGMRMRDLSRASGVPIATIKFYLREGLLQPGLRTAPNQAIYGEEHVRRIRLIRALREVGGLRIETIRRVLASVDGAENPWQILGRMCDAIGESRRTALAPSPEMDRAQADVDGFLESLGFRVRPESSARVQLAEALVAVRAAWGDDVPAEAFRWYSDAVAGLARREVEYSDALGRGLPIEGADHVCADDGKVDLSLLLESIVYGTVLFEPVLLAMRRLWHEHYAFELGLGGR